MHVEGFNQVVRKGIFLYGVPSADNRLDANKDVYQGQLVLAENIPTE